MGILDPKTPLANLMLFNDLFYIDNRLPGGEACTIYNQDKDSWRGHYLFDRPFSLAAMKIARESADKAGVPCGADLIHAHSGGPRFNSKPEIAPFRNVGSHTVSQTTGPEIIFLEKVK